MASEPARPPTLARFGSFMPLSPSCLANECCWILSSFLLVLSSRNVPSAFTLLISVTDTSRTVSRYSPCSFSSAGFARARIRLVTSRIGTRCRRPSKSGDSHRISLAVFSSLSFAASPNLAAASQARRAWRLETKVELSSSEPHENSGLWKATEFGWSSGCFWLGSRCLPTPLACAQGYAASTTASSSPSSVSTSPTAASSSEPWRAPLNLYFLIFWMNSLLLMTSLASATRRRCSASSLPSTLDLSSIQKSSVENLIFHSGGLDCHLAAAGPSTEPDMLAERREPEELMCCSPRRYPTHPLRISAARSSSRFRSSSR
mmetsp:Transcript_57767/g.135614  ORF Transcript_57767/g.135614 Transcript_57767/m.135614 type:complete len:318 (-) Transcript_57767:2921-3874(-)